MKQLEGLQYAMALDINKIFYTIQLSPQIEYMTIIVAKIDTFRYS